MKETFVRHKFQLLNSKRFGITLSLSSWSSEGMVEKYSVSYDNESKIERISEENILFREKISDNYFFDRLIRDIQSPEEKTREFASEILCNFIEFEIEEFDLNHLKSGVEKIIKQIDVEKNANSELKLVEGLFEFIWWEKLDLNEKVNLLERLTEIDSFQIWSYLESELEEELDKFNSIILSEYYKENRPKWDKYHNT